MCAIYSIWGREQIVQNHTHTHRKFWDCLSPEHPKIPKQMAHQFPNPFQCSHLESSNLLLIAVQIIRYGYLFVVSLSLSYFLYTWSWTNNGFQQLRNDSALTPPNLTQNVALASTKLFSMMSLNSSLASIFHLGGIWDSLALPLPSSLFHVILSRIKHFTTFFIQVIVSSSGSRPFQKQNLEKCLISFCSFLLMNSHLDVNKAIRLSLSLSL